LLNQTTSLNRTDAQARIEYETKLGATNSFTVTASLASVSNTSRLAFETTLQRPEFNCRFEETFSSGRLHNITLNLANVLQLNIDTQKSLISVTFTNLDQAQFQVNTESTPANKKGLYSVTSSLKNQQSGDVSSLTSNYNANSTFLEVVLDTYSFNFGMHNSTLATGVLTDTNTQQTLGRASVSIKANEFVVTAKYSPFWSQLKARILAKPRIELDFAQIFDEFKPAVEADLVQRQAITADFAHFSASIVDAYSSLGIFNNTLNSTTITTTTTTTTTTTLPQTTTPLYNTTLLGAYNGIAKVFNNLKAGIYKHSEALAEYVPALPLCELTDDAEFGSSFVLCAS